jgi:hypothetical protein
MGGSGDKGADGGQALGPDQGFHGFVFFDERGLKFQGAGRYFFLEMFIQVFDFLVGPGVFDGQGALVCQGFQQVHVFGQKKVSGFFIPDGQKPVQGGFKYHGKGHGGPEAFHLRINLTGKCIF